MFGLSLALEIMAACFWIICIISVFIVVVVLGYAMIRFTFGSNDSENPCEDCFSRLIYWVLGTRESI